MWFEILLSVLVSVVALFYWSTRGRYLPGILIFDNHPIVGNWPVVLKNLHRHHDWKLENARRAHAMGAEMLQRGGPFIGSE